MKIHAYPLHIGDWRSGTVRMSLAEEGAYLRLCNQYYLDGGIGWTEAECLRICGAVTRTEKATVRAVLAAKFGVTETGYIHGGINGRVARIEMASNRNQAKARRAAGLRWNTASDTSESDAPSIAEPMPEPMPAPMPQPCHPESIIQNPVDGDDSAPDLRDDLRDSLGWPADRRRWIGDLIALTHCADLSRHAWPMLGAGILTGWHETDRFEWRDVVAGITATVHRMRDPPQSWRYFAPAIARARADRTQPSPPHETRHGSRTRKTASDRHQDSTVAAFRHVFAPPGPGAAEPD
ncbi:hypothetical protein AEAC466_19220 [Asticcacaulis sp. AC466]|uniref:DUF1376 domain-containing protein n=1 Tax=Asticcacaulis sp. AC466 TaxID=1282362 RepID=UPI0003C3FAD0|nr:DUF1376 domain-containing protein [Asticcacaulis sp. AC466]ESQ82051.1 hypothetical protein AEAC466_19220 [Asticcacaulis sp. AC466]